MPLKVQKSRPLRIRYHDPENLSSVPVGSSSIKEEKLLWSVDPERSRPLLKKIAEAGSDVDEIHIEQHSKHKNYIRASFEMSIDAYSYVELFNSRNEMRGHYFAGKNEKDDYWWGDEYTRETIFEIMKNVDLGKAKFKMIEFLDGDFRTKHFIDYFKIHDKSIVTDENVWNGIRKDIRAENTFLDWQVFYEEIPALFGHGKIWTLEDEYSFMDWPTNDDRFPSNLRWHNFKDKNELDQLYQENFKKFKQEILKNNSLEGLDDKQKGTFFYNFNNFNVKFNKPRTPKKYAYDAFGKFLRTKNANGKIDVKGAWINMADYKEEANKEAKKAKIIYYQNMPLTHKKMGRAIQLKWFGAT